MGRNEMMDLGNVIPNLIFGSLVLTSGILIIRFRRQVNESVFKRQKRVFGDSAAKMSAGRQTPFMMGTVGCGFVAIGLIMVGFAVARILGLVG
jgi:uncharacterized membrane protein